MGNYIYVVKEKFKEQDKKYEFIGKQAISKLESNKKKLPLIIRKKIKESGGNLDLIEKLEIESSGPLKSRFDFKIEFFPKEKLVDFDVWKFKGGYIASKILTALEAKNLEPYFKLTIFKNGDYKYEYK